MAKVLQDIFIPGTDEVVQGFTINSWHVSQSVDALTGADAYDITISGSLDVIGPVTVTGSILLDPNSTDLASATDNLLFINLATGEVTIGQKLTTITGSFLTTASVSNNTITFTKGNSSQFSLVVNNVNNAISASYVLSSSYALTATSASFATTAITASYLNPIADSYVVLTQVSQSLNFADDAAAASSGVPLGGLYRSGNFILIRIS